MPYEVTTHKNTEYPALNDKRIEHEAVISAELAKLRFAYPTQARNFKQEEADIIQALWSEVFAGVDPVILHEAVIRFIKTDRKAFFPSPGQIMGVVEDIKKERYWREFERRERDYIDGCLRKGGYDL